MRSKLTLIFLCALNFALQVTATGTETKPIELKNDGSISADGLSMNVIYYSPKWRSRILNAKSLKTPKLENKDEEQLFTGSFELFDKNRFTVKNVLNHVSPGVWEYKGSLSSTTPIKTNVLALSISLQCKDYAGKEIIVNGKPIMLPAEMISDNGGHIWSGKIKTAKIPSATKNVNVDGNCWFRIQDNRKYKSDNYSVRIFFSKSKGDVQETDLKFNLSVK